jgi:hypothetical protein
MSTITTIEQRLLEKIHKLTPEKLSQVETFVDFLLQRDRHFDSTNVNLSESVLHKIWDNADDAEYDRL